MDLAESLSEKRRRAGKLGAAARWGHANRDGKVPSDAKRDGNWYRIVNRAAAAEILIYDEIGMWGITAKDFADELRDVTASTLNLFINSPGGEVFDGLAILNALRRHKATVNVTVDGLAASAASFIAMAGDTITMSRNSQMMIHDGLGLVIGNAADMRDMSERLDMVSDNIASIYAAAAGRRGGSDSTEAWRALMRDEAWFTATEAVEAGLADRVDGETEADTEDIENRFSSMLANFKHRSREDAPAPAIPERVEFAFDPEMFKRAFEEAS